jgi:hypothetical protein
MTTGRATVTVNSYKYVDEISEFHIEDDVARDINSRLAVSLAEFRNPSSVILEDIQTRIDEIDPFIKHELHERSPLITHVKILINRIEKMVQVKTGEINILKRHYKELLDYVDSLHEVGKKGR